jgi:hypothetical protein
MKQASNDVAIWQLRQVSVTQKRQSLKRNVDEIGQWASAAAMR